MALLFFDGFENDPYGRWSLSNSDISGVQFAAGRVTSTSLNMNTGTISGQALADTPPLSIAAGGTVIAGFAVKVGSISRNPGTILTALADGQTMWRLQANANGVLRFLGGAFDSASGAVLIQDTWHYVEIKVVMDDAAGSAQVRVDGTQVIDTGGGDVIDLPNQEVTQIRWRSEDGWDNLLDDCYVCDGTGIANNDFLGDVYVKQLTPSGQGNHADGVGSDGDSVDNYLLVDEATADDNDYVALLNAGAMESYTLAPLDPGEVPVGVRASTRHGQGDQSQIIDHFLRMGAVNHVGDQDHPVILAYGWGDTYWNTNPSTGLAWAEDDLDGVELGVRREV